MRQKACKAYSGQADGQVSSQRKYQFFISSTYTDLVEARQSLVLSLLKLGHFPVGLEVYPTEENNFWPVIQQQINECDYYVVMVGGRYGSLSPMGLSYTHREYVYAATRKKPILALVYDQPQLLPEDKREASRAGQMQLENFRQLVSKSDMCREWHSLIELRELVRTVVPQFVSRHPCDGWVRNGSQVASLETLRLQKRVDELERELQGVRDGGRPPAGPFPQHETLAVHYRGNVFVKGNCKLTDLNEQLSWGQILSCLGPQMLDDITEEGMRQALQKWLAGMALPCAQKVYPNAHAVSSVQISIESFNQIKVRLRVLGLIAKGSQRGTGETATWRLTSHGTTTLNQLLARARPH